ncbi:PAS domain-containing protein [Spirosoma sp. KNUC1025]|uniref:PAS domain-containing sensor histidine kinase n=1 Tax=Spirosoma sp. KNUC1025 TaxID=2894082 RepID=UPI00386A9F29|nr:PAS domain-containing protein [Spirosoma sp. KNUC1025]
MVFDRSYRFAYANQALLDMWGSTWEKSIGKGLLENGYEPWHAQMHEREIDQVMATRQTVRGEVSFPHATLGKRIYDYVFAPVLNELGEVEAIAGTTRDITDIRQAQEQIQESEARFRSLLEEAPVATMLMVGPEHIIELANEAMIRMLGKAASIVGQPATVAVPELASQSYLQLLNQVYTSGTTYEAKAMPGELVINGETQLHYFDFTYKPLRNAAGQVYGIISMATDVTEQVLIQLQATKNQRELLALFEQSPIGLATISTDEALVFQWVNPFYGQLVARKPEELVGKPLLVALPEIKGQGFDAILHNVIATGTPFIAPEIAVDILRDGELTTIYVDLTYQPRKGTHGDVEGILVVATDVTQQVMSRKKVEESESKLRAILATAPAGIGLFVGRDLVIDNPNQTFIDIVGKGPHIAGLPLREAMPELISEGQPFLQILDDVFTTGDPFISPGSLVKIIQNGVLTDNYYNISYSPVRNASGEIYAILDIAIDVTQEVKARQQLQEAEATLRGAIEVADMGTWELDMQSGITTYSPRLKDLFEFTHDFIEWDRLYSPIHEADQARLEAAVKRAASPDSDGLLDEEYTIVTQRTGRHRIVRAQAKMFSDQQGNPKKLVGSMRDVTEQRQTQWALEQQVQQRTEELAAANEELAATNEELAATNEELEASNEEYAALNEELEEANSLLIRSNDNLQTFAYVASHDLQEPLRKIQQFGDLLKTRYATSIGEELVYLERMQSAASRMSSLIKDLLNYSRISTQRDMSTLVPLGSVVERVLTDLEVVILETGAQITVEPLPSLSGDATQLGQLFQNLLSNALKFRRNGIVPQISIRSARVASAALPPSVKPARVAPVYHRIDVIDNGIGFDEKYLDRIFQVFQRLHGKREFAGTGIGLAICEKVVANHGGAITASSQLNKGATFSVYLPA